ncbi:MAG: TolC family protein, partial [Gammaproteobacteria bacterium]|nr:TolC family protein [Gammaproteobacteria bacterium]
MSKVALYIIAVGLLGCATQGFAQAPEGVAQAQLNLSLEAAIALAMRNNRELIRAQLGRVSERFSMRIAENKFRPHITIGSRIDRTYTTPSTDIHTLGLSSTVALRIPTGGAFEVDWSSGHRTGEVASDTRFANELRFNFTQPLLRGAGIGVNTASVRIARMIEEINLLALRQTIIDVVFRVTQRYRDYLQAGHRVDIRTQSLQRARDLLAVNELLVRTGRMAERDIVQTKADI